LPIESFIANFSENELIDLVEGTMSETKNSIVGISSDIVPGAAGQTAKLMDKGIDPLIMADGPAGLRLQNKYQRESEDIYQYATAWPIGTALAQTWNQKLVQRVGQAVGVEMLEFGVDLWLAPGMNIHRDPLGGRNFEYFSEDPLLSGTMAASETKGVQSQPGIGVVLKHFLGNNQESYRNIGDSIIGEQALREIYLKNFEIAIKIEQPIAIMSSYNKVNGCFSGENFEALTNILRDEWHFEGLVMTDWFSQADPKKSLHAGNDLIMPGDSKNILLGAISNLAPEFDNDGNIKTVQKFDFATEKLEKIPLWNDFEFDTNGDIILKMSINENNPIDENLENMILNGDAQIIDENNVLVRGSWKDNNDLYLGDLQKSAINILNVILKLKFRV
jgi:Beta-glucosidase-related glycosidases